jgi:hypothetical protein
MVLPVLAVLIPNASSAHVHAPTSAEPTVLTAVQTMPNTVCTVPYRATSSRALVCTLACQLRAMNEPMAVTMGATNA